MTLNKITRNLGLACAVSTSAIICIPALAADNDNSEASQSLAPIDVTSGTVGSAATEANKLKKGAPNAVEVIADDQLDQYNEQALGDALRRLPSVSFDGANRAREVRLRGLPSKYTQVLVNGRPFTDGESNRTVEVDRIPTGLVERVEIIRSPRASQRGQGAAGTVNIVLKSGAELPEQTEVTAGLGYLEDNDELAELGLTHVGQKGSLRYTFAGSLQQFRRNESADTFEFDGNRQPDSGELELNERKFEQINLFPQFEITVTPSSTLSIEPFYTRTKEFRTDLERELSDDQQQVVESANESRERPREFYGVRADWQQSLTASMDLSLEVDWQEGTVDTERTERQFDGDGNFTGIRLRDESRDIELVRPKAALSMQSGSHELEFGIGADLQEHDENNSEVEIEANQPVDSGVRPDRVFEVDEDVLFAYGEDIWTATDQLTVTSGLRFEDSDTETTSFDGETNSEDISFALPSVNLVYDLTSQTQLRAGVARTLRRPDLRSLTPVIDEEDGTASDPDEQGNPNQEPESIWGFDAGVDHYFADDRGYASVNLFHREFDDKIEPLIEQGANGRFVSRPRNVGDGQATGLELSGRAPLTPIGGDNVTLWGNATYTADTSVDEPGGGSREFLNQPDWTANLGVDYYLPAWRTTFGLSVNHVDSVDQEQSLAGGGRLARSIDSRTRIDLSARTEISDKLTFTLSATNLNDETEDREAEVFDAGGNLDSVEREIEPTFQQIFARLNWSF